MYHNTTSINSELRAEYEQAALGQESLVLGYFRAEFPRELTPEQVQAAVLPNAPITSVRRAISDLTRAGHLMKLHSTVLDQYGKPIHQWAMAGTFKQQELF